MKPIRRVGIFIDLIGAYGRGIFLGLRKYAEEVGNWNCKFPSTWPVGHDIDLSDWNVDGWIGYSNEHKLGAHLKMRPAPLVSVSTAEATRGNPAVAGNNEAIGKMAFDYLFQRGHRNFAYVGHWRAPFSEQRLASYAREVEAAGKTCHRYVDYLYTHKHNLEVRSFLASLPKPVAVLTDNDSIGTIVLDLCREEGLAVPEEIAVLSVDNDELLCSMRVPTLSSIQLDTTRIGYEAAATLDRILDGEPPPRKALTFPPLYVVTRESTDALAFMDEEVRRAVEFIHARVGEPTSAADVLRNATISARPLEQRFRRELKCSILQYIHKVHVEHAKHLLMTTDWPVGAIAAAAGFTSATRMGLIFREVVGKTPTEVRREAGGVAG